MLLGSPEIVGAKLAELVVRHTPSSIGLALILDDLLGGIDASAEAFKVMSTALEQLSEEDP